MWPKWVEKNMDSEVTAPEGKVTSETKDDEDIVTPSEEVADPFAYIKDKGFTTEIYKIEIQNLPKKLGIQQLRKKLHTFGLAPGKIRAFDYGHHAFVNFRSEQDRDDALQKLQDHVWKGKQLRVKVAKPSADPLVQKRKNEAELGNQSNKKKKRDDDLPNEERLKNAVTPWWKMPYEDQLKKKANVSKEYLQKFSKEVSRNNYGEDYQKWLKQQRKENSGLACKLHPIKSSPLLTNYRNKCEFSIGNSPDGVAKTVGFRLGGYKSGDVTVMEPVVNNVPEAMKNVAKDFQLCLQESKYESLNLVNITGHYHQLTVRTTTSGGIMAFLKMHPQDISKEGIEKEKERIKSYFKEKGGMTSKISSLYLHLQTDREKEPSEETLLGGESHIYEDLLGLKFRISPSAFFQVNTAAAEILYTQVTDWCSISSNTVLLDVCCGTGTIGLTMAKKVKKVIGIEMCSEAVEDAKVNATLNGIDNAEFHCGKAEQVLPSLMRRLWGADVVAVVDPPRDGLHPSVVLALRKYHYIQRVVYVSCKPTGAFQNILDLTRSQSNRVQGIPYKLTEAVAVDLFPQTPHYELVMKFERDTRKKKAPETSGASNENNSSEVKERVPEEDQMKQDVTDDAHEANKDEIKQDEVTDNNEDNMNRKSKGKETAEGVKGD